MGKGQMIVGGIAVYLVAKSILNLVLGFGLSNIIMLVLFLVMAVCLWNRVPFIQYITAGFLVVMFLGCVRDNLANVSQNWIYLLEGFLDFGAAALLLLQNDVKAFFAGTD